MKNITTLILFILSVSFTSIEKPFATNYYVSETGSDSNPGTISSPFKTLAKASSVGSTGDSVLFKGGESFYGTLNCRSGVNYGSYGGGKAIIEGFTTLSLTQSGNLYTAAVNTGMVIMDGKFVPYGRYPKTGYINTTAAGTNSMTGSFTGNYAGGEVVWRPYHWVLWRGTVVSQSGSTVNYSAFPATSGGSVYPAKVGWGFFFQNSPSACTQLGEWSCVNNKLSIFLNNSSHVVRAATITNIVNLNGVSNVSVSNLIIQGANGNAFYMPSTKNIIITGVDVKFCGQNFIYGNSSSSNIGITNSTFDYAMSNGIIANSSSWIINNNSINHIGSVAGMGGSGEGQYFAILNVKSSTVTNNSIRNVGYNGICFQGTNNIIKNNFVDSFCFIKDDGAAIYCGGQNNSGTVITGNVITNGIGAPEGTPDKTDPRGFGIYPDDGASNLEISFNTIAYTCAGIYPHNAHEINIHDNLVVDSKITGIKYYNDKSTIKNISLNGNTFYSFSNKTLSSAFGGSTAPPSYFSSADLNYWNPGKVFLAPASYDLAGWKNYIGKETNSKTIAVSSANLFKYNPTGSAQTFSLPGSYQDIKGNIYSGQITLQPYAGILLFPSSAPPQTFFNQAVSQSMSTTCPSGSTISATYGVPANKYSSTISLPDANGKAKSEIDQWWQNMINNCGCADSVTKNGN